jgi:WD40 repeat protein
VIAALPREIAPSDVELFRTKILLPFRESHPTAFGQLVGASLPVSDELIAEAGKSNIHLFSLVEYQGLIDLGPYLARLSGKLADHTIYSEGLYVPQRAKIAHGFPGQDTPELNNALEELDNLLALPSGRFALVLGDFGTGKTFLLRRLASILIKRGAPPYPVLVEMRSFDKAQSLDSMLSAHFSNNGLDKFNTQAFRYMLREGLVALLFDGFDELVHRVHYDRAAEHFDTVLEAADGKAKVVVTSRTQHFYSDKQIAQALAKRAEAIPGYRVATLCAFDRPQIEQFFERLLGNREEAMGRVELLDEIKDLLGLSENPRMLSFIAGMPPERLRAVSERTGEITSAKLYQELLDWWLTKESERVSFKGALESLTTEDRWSAVTALALRLWSTQAPAVSYTELPGDVARAIQGLSARKIDEHDAAQQLGSGTVLVRDSEGNFSFLHRSVLEWLVAKAAAEEIQKEQRADILQAQTMSDLMADFFWQLATKERAEEWARGELKTGTAKSNALRVLRRLGVMGIGGADLARQDLRGTDLSEQDLRGADLRGANLTDATLYRADLSDAFLTNAILVRANLREANLANANLERADLSFSTLLGADLRGARLEGTNLQYAELIGSKWSTPPDGAPASSFGASYVSNGAAEAVFPSRSWPCTSALLSADGAFVASAHSDLGIRLWNASIGELIKILRGHSSAIARMALSSDNALLASGDDAGNVILWNVTSGEQKWAVKCHSTSVVSLGFSNDDSRIVSGSLDGSIRVADVESNEILHATKLPNLPSRVTCITSTTDGYRVALGYLDGTVRVWPATGRVLEGHWAPIKSLVFSTDGHYLASGSEDHTIRVWNVESCTPRDVYKGHADAVVALAFSPDNTLLVSGAMDRTIQFWDLYSGEVKNILRSHNSSATSVGFSAKSPLLVSGSLDGSVQVWDSRSGNHQRSLISTSVEVNNVTFSPGGLLLASSAKDTAVRLWDLKSGRLQKISRSLGLTPIRVAFSTHGALAACSSNTKEGGIRLWNLFTNESRRLPNTYYASESIAFSPDGAMLVTYRRGHSDVILWDTESCRPLSIKHTKGRRIHSVSLSGDGSVLSLLLQDDSFEIWRKDSEEAVKLPSFRRLVSVNTIALSHAGRFVACGGDGGAIHLFDLESGKQARFLNKHTASVERVVFSARADILVSYSTGGTIIIWDLSSHAEICVLTSLAFDVQSIALSPDGTILAVASSGSIALWNIASGIRTAELIPNPEGWAIVLPDGRYKLSNDGLRAFWYAAGLCRFEPGELDAFAPSLRRVGADEPLSITG